MILYKNDTIVGVIFTWTGSIIPRSTGLNLLSFSIGVLLAILRVTDNSIELFEETFKKPFIVMIYATAVGYLLVMRTNIALERWMSAMSQVEVMLSRWADAYNALNSFFAGKKASEEEMERIQLFRIRIAHWFSIMACLAFSTLRARSLRSLKDIPIQPRYPLNGLPTQLQRRTTRQSFRAPRSQSSAASLDCVTATDPRVKTSSPSGREPLVVLHAPSPEEVRLLEPSSDKVNTVCLWIIQSIMIEVRAKTLDSPPPIVTRVFQEISSGMLGFQQAHKVAMVPFPFPFSQMVALLLWAVYITFPFFIDIFTKNIIITPVLSFVLATCYSCINQLSIELEDPFGYSYNEIDVEIMNNAFNTLLEDTLWGPLEPPVGKTHDLERTIRDGIATDYNVRVSNFR
jgi:predicted membrane chloride channel (bestrophin family)